MDLQLDGLSHKLEHLTERVYTLHEEIYGNAFRPGLVGKIVELGKQLDDLAERHQRLESIIYKNYQATFAVGLIVFILTIQILLSLWR